MIFDGWESLARTGVAGIVAYAALVAILRISGKRTLSKLNAFDLVVTVALGSTLASVLTSRQVPLVDGILALALLVALQFGVAWSASRFRWVNRVVKSEPRVLFERGVFAREAMRVERVTEDEVIAAVREASVGALEEVEFVILESSGDISVVRTAPAATSERDVLRGVRVEGRRHETAAERPPS